MVFDIEKISVITNAQERCIGKCNYICYIGDSFEHFRSSYTSIRPSTRRQSSGRLWRSWCVSSPLFCSALFSVVRTVAKLQRLAHSTSRRTGWYVKDY